MSQESKTPRTDAVWTSAGVTERNLYRLSCDLERELAAVTEERDALMASARIKEANSGWRPIETAPKDGRPVWARGWNFNKEENGYHYQWAWWNADEGHWESQYPNPSAMLFVRQWLAVDRPAQTPYCHVGTDDDGLSEITLCDGAPDGYIGHLYTAQPTGAALLGAIQGLEASHTGMLYGDEKRNGVSDYTRGWGDCLGALKSALGIAE